MNQQAYTHVAYLRLYVYAQHNFYSVKFETINTVNQFHQTKNGREREREKYIPKRGSGFAMPSWCWKRFPIS